MRNTEMAKLDGLVGVDDDDLKRMVPRTVGYRSAGHHHHRVARGVVPGRAVAARRRRAPLRDELVLGRSDPNNRFVALYQDDRGVCRQFAMTFDGGHWTMSREDPDFHQRFIANVEKDRILGRWEASEDAGKTWRKDLDLTFERS